MLTFYVRLQRKNIKNEIIQEGKIVVIGLGEHE